MHSAARDEAYEIESLLDQLGSTGPRPPTSPAEARAAAFVNGRLRRAGMGVSTYELRSARRPGGAYAALAAVGLVAAALTPLLPLPSLLVAVLLLCALLYDALAAPLPPVGRLGVSQNIVGTRAVAGAGGLDARRPRWRVLLLAPLDSPTARGGLARLAAPSRGPALARTAAAALLAVAAAAAWIAPFSPWWLALAGAVGLFFAILVADLLPSSPTPADGSLAALAVLVAAATRLGVLDRVELWAVAVGAAGSDPRGVASLLQRYPFDPASTLVLALEQLAGGQLVYATREGVFAGSNADPLLLRLAAAADAADPRVDAEPRALTEAGALVVPLRRRGLRALTIVARPPLTVAEPAAAGAVDPLLVERATRLVVGVVRALEREP